MRKIVWSTAAVLVALAATGVAVANEGESRTTKAVTATFSAELGDHAVRTCTGADGRYRRLSGEWEGESESTEASLDGPLTLKGTAWIHVPTGNGSFEGRLRIGDEGGAKASLTGVISNGKLEGFATGKSGKRELRLLANVSATLTADGLADGKLGGGGGANSAVLVKGSCPEKARSGEDKKKEQPREDEKGERKQREFAGTVAAVSREWLSLKVGEETVKCEVPAGAAADLVAGLPVGTKVVALCYLEDDHWHLVKVRKVDDAQKTERKVRELEGTLSAFAEGSLTVSREGKDALTCAVGEKMAAELGAAGYAVGTRVYAACVDEGRGLVLVKIKKLA